VYAYEWWQSLSTFDLCLGHDASNGFPPGLIMHDQKYNIKNTWKRTITILIFMQSLKDDWFVDWVATIELETFPHHFPINLMWKALYISRVSSQGTRLNQKEKN
jgi:hypothetical protein